MAVRLIFLSLLFVSGALWAAPAPVDGLPLPERIFPELEVILRDAVRRAPRFVQQSLAVELAEQGRIEAAAGLRPSVEASLRGVQSRDYRADISGPLDITKVAFGTTVSQPLYHWGERRNRARIGEIAQLIAEQNFREAYRQLAQEIRRGFLSLIVQKTALARAQLAQRQAHDRARLTAERGAAGELSPTQLLTLQLGVEQGDLAVERAEFEFAASLGSFARLAGLADFPATRIPDELPAVTPPPAGPADLLAGFLQEQEPPGPPAFIRRQELAIADLNYENQRTRLRPKLSLLAGVSQDEQSFIIAEGRRFRVTSLFAGVAVNWTLFDGFAARAGRHAALLRRRQLANDYEQFVEALARHAQSQEKYLGFAARHMAITDRYLELGASQWRTQRAEAARGAVAEQEVVQAEISLLDARVNAFNARLDYLVRLGDFLGTIAADPILANLAPLDANAPRHP